jgi:putative DNA primase/helicase
MAVARIFVRSCLHQNILTLRHWRAGWWMWKTTHWVEVHERAVRSILYHFTEHARYVNGLTLKEWAPTQHKIGDLIDALAAICVLPNDIDQPGWLDGAAEQPASLSLFGTVCSMSSDDN